MSVFNIIGFLLIAGTTIFSVASAGPGEPSPNKCDDKSSHKTKSQVAKDCIDAVIKKIEGQTPKGWNATVYCENKSNLTQCVTDCFNDMENFNGANVSIAGKIIDHTCEYSRNTSANTTDVEFMQKSVELLLVKHANGTQCLTEDKVKNDVKTALQKVPNVDQHTGPLSKIIISNQSACGTKEPEKAGQNEKTNNNSVNTESDVGNSTTMPPEEHKNSTGNAEAPMASIINVAVLITVLAPCVPGYF